MDELSVRVANAWI